MSGTARPWHGPSRRGSSRASRTAHSARWRRSAVRTWRSCCSAMRRPSRERTRPRRATSAAGRMPVRLAHGLLTRCAGASARASSTARTAASSRPAMPPAQSSRPSSCATRSCNRTKHKGRPSPHSLKDERCSKEYGIAYDHVGYAVSFCSCCEISTTPIKFHHMTKVCFFDRQSFRLLYHADIIPMLSKRLLGRLEHRKAGFYDPADKMDHFLFAVLVIALHNDMHQTV